MGQGCAVAVLPAFVVSKLAGDAHPRFAAGPEFGDALDIGAVFGEIGAWIEIRHITLDEAGKIVGRDGNRDLPVAGPEELREHSFAFAIELSRLIMGAESEATRCVADLTHLSYPSSW